ncbi:hypothetical protein [Arthrobacter sp. STN4]|nr:hypothetical protein [Arthrobacter sp. STN4]MCQ9164214.1 hypothetical protein [Arthrobacter sp. STN4]
MSMFDMAASLMAGRTGVRIPEKIVKRGLGILVLVISAYMAVQALLS